MVSILGRDHAGDRFRELMLGVEAPDSKMPQMESVRTDCEILVFGVCQTDNKIMQIEAVFTDKKILASQSACFTDIMKADGHAAEARRQNENWTPGRETRQVDHRADL